MSTIIKLKKKKQKHLVFWEKKKDERRIRSSSFLRAKAGSKPLYDRPRGPRLTTRRASWGRTSDT